MGEFRIIYPLSLSFKIVALAPQIFVRDANGQSICYVKQKLFKLKEAVKVYGDESKSQILCEMNADRIIDWSATYRFSDADGEIFGSVRRKGTRSFWKAHYEIFDEDEVQIASIQEENPMSKVADGILCEIPGGALLSGYFFHPRYLVSSNAGQPLLRLTKQRAMLESKFSIEKLSDLDPVNELRLLMAILMASLLERARG